MKTGRVVRLLHFEYKSSTSAYMSSVVERFTVRGIIRYHHQYVALKARCATFTEIHWRKMEEEETYAC